MASKLVTVPTGSDQKTVSVSQGSTLRGRVLLPDGSPAANTEVAVSVHSRLSGTVFPEIRIGTKEDGTFAITNIPAGRIWYAYPKMESLAACGVAGEAVPFETKDDGEEVDVGTIKLQPAFTLLGKVVLSDGAAIPPDMRVTVSSGVDSQIVPLKQDGTFEARGLAKGVYEVASGIRGYRPANGYYGEALVDRDGKSIIVPVSPATAK